MAVLLLAAAAVTAMPPNMNGGYTIANPNTAHGAGNWTGEYSEMYGSKLEYFDVYSPLISTVYGQVYWTVMDAVDLDEALVKRFEGKTMAIVGYESDQVMKSPDGVSPDVHVPITAAYNHHYGATIASKHATFIKRKVDTNNPASTAGHPDADGYETVAVDSRGDAAPPNSIPSVVLHEGNGGEYRKSFHGYPHGHAQFVESPATFTMQPMQIDTWNREHDMHAGFVPGPEPASSFAPVGDDAKHIYSGLLECPCTDRITKEYDFGGKTTQTAGVAPKPASLSPSPASSAGNGDAVRTLQDCAHAASQLKLSSSIKLTTASGANTSMPRGCSITLVPHSGHQYNPGEETETKATVYFNTAAPTAKTADCGGGGSTPPTLYGAALKADVSGSPVGMTIRADSSGITMALAGPADVWFGVGINASKMAGAYAVVVDGYGNVTERLLADQGNGNRLLPRTATVLSSAINAGRRVVWVRIPAASSSSPNHPSHAALAENGQLPILFAAGSGPAFAYHAYKTAAEVMLAGVGVPSCIVSGGSSSADVPFGKGTGKLLYTPPAGEPGTSTSHTIGANATTLGFAKDCLPYPQSTMLLQKNAECDIRTYTGGQSCCHHLFTLLDKNQSTPWQDKKLEYQMKFRVWFKEVGAPGVEKIANVQQFNWGGMATPTEYDVPKCSAGVPGCSYEDGRWVHRMNGTWAVQDMVRGPLGPDEGVQYRTIHGHCHAPACLLFELFNAETNELVCRQVPVYGTSNATFDEAGYLSVPPCLYGDASEGLLPAVTYPGNATFFSTKTCQADYGHHGEMSLWQTYGVRAPLA